MHQTWDEVPNDGLQGSSIATRISASLKGISLERAVRILESLGADHDPVFYSKDAWIVRDFLNTEYFPEFQGRLAKEVRKIFFYGGPRIKSKIHGGSLETLLWDRILYSVGLKGIETVASVIGLGEHEKV